MMLARFIRDTTIPMEDSIPHYAGDVLDMSPESFARWTRLQAVESISELPVTDEPEPDLYPIAPESLTMKRGRGRPRKER